MTNPAMLRRYTSLPVLIDMLVHRRFSLIGFNAWKDVNDRRGLSLYKEALQHKFLGAMCLTSANETFHHWQVFSEGSAGVCVVLVRERLQAIADTNPDLIAGEVDYVLLDKIGSIPTDNIHKLPFLKREGFRPENEFRIIGCQSVAGLDVMHVPFEADLIDRVIFSPFLHPTLVESAKVALRAISGWNRPHVSHSNLTDNKTWQSALAGFAHQHGVEGEDQVVA